MGSRFDRWFRSEEQTQRDIDEEIHTHLEARIEHLVTRGMTPEAARVEAMRRFGDLEAGRAALLAQARAHRRRLRLADRFEQLLQDVRYVTRVLARSPSFSLGVIATLALGLGINAAVFRVADHVLFKPPSGVGDARAIRRVETSFTFSAGAPQRAMTFSYIDAEAIARGGAFADVVVYSLPRIQRNAQGRDIAVSAVDARYFPMLGVDPVPGRGFTEEEAAPGASRSVAIVSFAWWQRELGGAPLTDASLVTLNRRPFRVIGVAPRHFSGIDLDPVDVWIPLGDGSFGQGSINGVIIPWYRSDMLRALRIIGRPAAGQSDAVVLEKLDTMFRSLDTAAGRPVRTGVLHSIVPVGDPTRNQDAHRLLGRLSGVAGVVFLLACANVVNLLLARGLRRRQEIGIRLAVGATRGRVMRLLVVESVLLALAGGVAATVCGLWMADALRRLVFPDARWTSVLLDQRTILFTAAMTLGAGMIAGLVPAMQVTRPDVSSGLKNAPARGGRSRSTRAALIMLQTALSLALLVTSGLLVTSLVRLNAVHLGFDPAGLVTVSMGTMLQAENPGVAEEGTRLAGMPAVRALAFATIAPFGAMAVMDVSVPGSPYVPESSRDQPRYNIVSDNYFAVMGSRVIRGRGFGPADVAGAELVSVVNESMARRYWGTTSPFASCVLSSWGCARVVGVVEDVRDSPAVSAAPAQFYLPIAQSAQPASVLIIRTTPGEAAAVTAATRTLFPPPRRVTIEVIADRVARALHPWRTATTLFVTLGVVALTLAAVGIYSVMSYIVSERLHELGIRVALGATRADILRLIVGGGLRLIVTGGAIGLLGAAGIGRLLGAMLFEVSPFEPGVYAAAFGSIAALALGAMLPPARRAARANPVTALRSE